MIHLKQTEFRREYPFRGNKLDLELCNKLDVLICLPVYDLMDVNEKEVYKEQFVFSAESNTSVYFTTMTKLDTKSGAYKCLLVLFYIANTWTLVGLPKIIYAFSYRFAD